MILIMKEVSRYGNGGHERYWLEWVKVTSFSVSGTHRHIPPLSELGTFLMKSS